MTNEALLRAAADGLESRSMCARDGEPFLRCSICETPDDPENGPQHSETCFITELRTAAPVAPTLEYYRIDNMESLMIRGTYTPEELERLSQAWKVMKVGLCTILPEPSFQEQVRTWVIDCFGPEIADDKAERCHRFFEEACELVQAGGMTINEAYQLCNYVWERAIGGMQQEIGGVAVTFSALVSAFSYDLRACAMQELHRIQDPTTTEKIREKQKNKPRFSPLP